MNRPTEPIADKGSEDTVKMIGTTQQTLAKGSTLMVWMRHLLLGVGFALAAWLLVRILVAIAAPSSLWEPVLVSTSAMSQPSVTTRYDVSYNPFAAGDPVEVMTERVETRDDAPETTLNLQLKGLRSGENGTAFIRTPDGQEDNIYVDEEVMPGVILRAVFPDYVLIDVNGQTQRLTTDDAKADRRAGNSPASRPATGLQTLRSADASTLLSQVQIIPSFDTSMTRNGVVVKPRSSAVELSDFGLRDGDIITRLAGQSLVSGLPDIAALRRTVSSGRPVVVDLLRDGQPMTITIGSSS